MNNHRKLSSSIIGVFVIVTLLAGCAETRVKTEQPGSMTDIHTVLVLDFYDVTVDHGDSGMIKCPLCGNYFEAGQVPPETADRLTETAVEMMSRRTNISLLFNNRPVNQETDGASERRFLLRVGQAAGADAVLTGYIYRYIDRVGTDFAAESPASVALSVHLVRVSDGVNIWSGYIDETQQTLAEDLFKTSDFLRRRGRWVSADEMARSGLENIFESFPKQ